MRVFAQCLSVVLGLLLTTVLFAQDDVILQRGDIIVTVDDVEHYIISNIPAEKRSAVLAKPTIFKEMAENLYIIRSLARDAEQDTELDWQQLNWEFELQRQRILMIAEFNKDKEDGLKNIDWDAVAKEIYLIEGDTFMASDQVHVAHILIKAGNERTDEEALAIATDVRARAVAGEDFSELAKAMSDDPSAQNNSGDLGFFGRGQMVKSFEEASFSMKKAGEISEPVKSSFGYHVILFYEYKPAEQLPFEQAKKYIIEQQQEKIAKQIREDRLIALRSATDITLNVDLLHQLEKKYRSVGGENK